MLKFEGPFNEKTPHARFLYRSFIKEDKAKESFFENFYKALKDLDRYIEDAPRVFKAHEYAYIYLFGPEAKEYWFGREVTGFIPPSEKEFNVFDSFRGEGISWELAPGESLSGVTFDALCLHAQQLRSLAGEALAKTWRIKLGPLESHLNAESNNLPHIAFQFFKTH
jgi:hypothetical protein